MEHDALATFTAHAQAVFGPLSSRVVADVRAELESLLAASPTEPWLAELHACQPATKELVRDAMHGYLLLAHTETAGLYRPPHDHGRGWVIYGLERGEMEISTYARVEDERGQVRLVRRETSTIRAGDVRAYWPGDIHDTRCTNGPSLLFRFTDRDLKKEDLEARRVTRYPEPSRVCPLRPS